MKWGAVLGISVLIALIFLNEWPQMHPEQKKEKAVFTSVLVMGWLLGVLLVFYPDLPGPDQLLDHVFKPLGKLLEK